MAWSRQQCAELVGERAFAGNDPETFRLRVVPRFLVKIVEVLLTGME